MKAGNAEMAMNVKKDDTNINMAALDLTSIQSFPMSKNIVPTQMHSITYMATRIQKTPKLRR